MDVPSRTSNEKNMETLFSVSTFIWKNSVFPIVSWKQGGHAKNSKIWEIFEEQKNYSKVPKIL